MTSHPLTRKLAQANTRAIASGGGAGAAVLSPNMTLNLGGAGTAIGMGGDFPYMNLMKSFGFQNQSNAFPLVFDVNNYLVSAPTSTLQGNTPMPLSTSVAPEIWCIDWQGKAGDNTHIAITMLAATTILAGAAFISGSTAVNTQLFGTNGYVEFTFNAAAAFSSAFPYSLTFQFPTTGTFDGTFANLRLYRKVHKADLDAGKIFNPDFLAKVRPLNLRAIRPVNYTGVNGTNCAANASQRTRLDALSWSTYWDISVFMPAAVTGTNAYTGTLAGVGAYVEGLTVSGLFTNASSSAATRTFDLNGLGVKPILDQLGNAAGSTAVSANSMYTLVFDAILQGWIQRTGAPGAGVPVEVICALCNELGVACHYNIPTHATDAYVAQIATTFKTLMPVNEVWYEYSLEIWNFAAGFPQTTWAVNRGIALGFPSDNNRRHFGYYGLRFKQLMDVITATYAGQPNFKRLMAGWEIDPGDTYRLKGTDLNTALGYAGYNSLIGVSYNVAPNRPIDMADYLAYAMYTSGAQVQGIDGTYVSRATAKTVTGGQPLNPVRFTIAAHGWASTHRVRLASFTGTWASLNNIDAFITVIDANTISVPIDGTGFGAYSANGGTAGRYSVEFTGFANAAADYDSGITAQMNAALAWMDSDIRAGANYGVTGTQCITSHAAYHASWNALAVTYGKKVILYEGGFEGDTPGANSAYTLGYGLQGVVTFNASASPYVLWPGHTVKEGARVIFSNSGGALPSSATAATNYFATNIVPGVGFDISVYYYPLNVIISSGVGTGTHTCTAHGRGFNNLFDAYKSSDLFKITMQFQFSQFFSYSESLYGAWYELAAKDRWSLMKGDIYTSEWKSYDAIKR